MDLGIAGRSAIVCGSSRGLGLACATALAAEGVNVVLNGIDADRLAKAAEDLRAKSKANVAPVQADVHDRGGSRQAVGRSRTFSSTTTPGRRRRSSSYTSVGCRIADYITAGGHTPSACSCR